MSPEALRDITFFGALSVAVHLAIFAQLGPNAVSGSGAGGQSIISLEAVSGDLQALVEDWTRPPETQTATKQPTSVDTSDAPTAPQTTTNTVPRSTAPTLTASIAVSQAPDLTASAPARPTPPQAQAQSQIPQPTASTAPARPDQPQTPQTAQSDAAPSIAPPPQPKLAETRPKPHPRRPPQQAAQPALRASGSGQGATTGTAGTAQAASTNADQTRALQAQWSARIQARIARAQRYPRGNHGNGRVKIQMQITRDGQLQGVAITYSSGRPALDQAALRAVQRAAPFPPAPHGLKDEWFRVAQWMKFERR